MRDYEQEQKTAAYEAEQMAGKSCGMVGNAATKPRIDLRERVRIRIRATQLEADKMNRLAELDYLLEKHPEVVRLVELILSENLI